MTQYYNRKLSISRTSAKIDTAELINKRKISAEITEIPRLEHLTEYWHFFDSYLLPNKPCIINKICDKWRCRRDWVKPDGSPNFQFIKQTFGDAKVPVANCGDVKYDAHTKEDMTVKGYMEYWEDYRSDDYPESSKCLYLKDWHFTRDFADYEVYCTPDYFCSDWLNEFWDTKKDLADDYRFVYMGPKGSWTPFHADVFRSHSWSANICGRKKWIFYPPGEEDNLKDCFGHMTLDITSHEMSDRSKYPRYNLSRRPIEIIQEAGEVMFVPSGWYHQVHNLEDTISVNHNWMNGCNVDLCWKHIRNSLCDVQKEISDCRDMEGWHQHCQVILKACSGIDYIELIQFMEMIATSRMRALQNMVGKQKNEAITCNLYMSSLLMQPSETSNGLKMKSENKNVQTVAEEKQQEVLADVSQVQTQTEITSNKLQEVSYGNQLNGAHSPTRIKIKDFTEDASSAKPSNTESSEKLFLTEQLSYKNHLLFDLRRVKYVLEEVLRTEEIRHLDLSVLNCDIDCFLKCITSVLDQNLH